MRKVADQYRHKWEEADKLCEDPEPMGDQRNITTDRPLICKWCGRFLVKSDVR